MRKITKEAVYAFNRGFHFKKSNTEVTQGAFYLHGNKIAKKVNGGVLVSDGGWQSNTTKERLNGILSNYGLLVIQKNWNWYIIKNDFLNDKRWKFDDLKDDSGFVNINKLPDEYPEYFI